MLEWAALWKALPKAVFSATLPAVQGHAAGLRRPGGGNRTAAGRPGAGRHRDRRRGPRRRGGRAGPDRWVPGQVYPVLAGGGIPFVARGGRRVDLELAETRTFSSKVAYLRYRVT